MLKQIATGAAFLVAIAATGAFLVAKAAPEPGKAVAVSRLGKDKSFAPICKSGEITDSRPDPVWVGASFADDKCRAPRVPAPVDGFTASREQVVAGMAAVKNYIAASDAFQRCIHDFVAARKADKKPIDMSLVIIETHRVIASENSKKKVADQVKVAINAFNEYGSECPDR
ncbi:MAG TPA: hypothetical protein VEM35_09765 [Rhizomicrobium sp.]|nr:hypothetical protein [Rhizomicrobium sp.]